MTCNCSGMQCTFQINLHYLHYYVNVNVDNKIKCGIHGNGLYEAGRLCTVYCHTVNPQRGELKTISCPQS